MVYLSKIYTKTGDAGETALGDGSRVPKDHPRVNAYGTVDELNAVIGLLLARQKSDHDGLLRDIQNDLFDVGADLCVPTQEDAAATRLRVRAEQSVRLEKAIDQINVSLVPLTSFVLPGGSEAAALCHLARTVCRRAERDIITLARTESINREVIVYLNRLSDLLFVLGRACNQGGAGDILWEPGKTQAP